MRIKKSPQRGCEHEHSDHGHGPKSKNILGNIKSKLGGSESKEEEKEKKDDD